MVHKYCIGLKKLPGLHQQWICDLCVLASEGKDQAHRLPPSPNIDQNLYEAENNCGNSRNQKLQSILKNEERHIELISSRRAQNKNGVEREPSGKLNHDAWRESQISDFNSDLAQHSLGKRSTLLCKRAAAVNPPATRQSDRLRNSLPNVVKANGAESNESNGFSHASLSTNAKVSEHIDTRTCQSQSPFSLNGKATEKNVGQGFKGRKIVECLLCGRTGSAMLKVHCSSGRWAHLSCAYWLPEAAVDLTQRTIYLSKKLIHFASRKTWGTPCLYCKAKIGLTTSCAEGGCKTYFHVECARLVHCEMKFPYQLGSKQKNHAIFCHLHSKSESVRKFANARVFEKNRFRTFMRQFDAGHQLMREDLHTNCTGFVKRHTRKQKLVVHLRRTGSGSQRNFEYLYSKLS